MRRYRLISHPKYDLKVHLVWCPKYRKRALTGPVATRGSRSPAADRELIKDYIIEQKGDLSTRTMVDFKSTPLEPLAFKARVVQLNCELQRSLV